MVLVRAEGGDDATLEQLQALEATMRDVAQQRIMEGAQAAPSESLPPTDAPGTVRPPTLPALRAAAPALWLAPCVQDLRPRRS